MDMKEAQTSQAKTMVVDDLQENRKAARKKEVRLALFLRCCYMLPLLYFVFSSYQPISCNGRLSMAIQCRILCKTEIVYWLISLFTVFMTRSDTILLYFYPKGHDVDEYYVKRIYGLPGETVYIDNNSIYINGKRLTTHMQKDAMDDSQIELGTKEKPYTLKSDEYYVLGRSSFRKFRQPKYSTGVKIRMHRVL